MSTVSAATTAWHTALSSTATRRLDAAGQQQHPHPALDLRERMSAAPFVNPYDAMLSRAFDAIPNGSERVRDSPALVGSSSSSSSSSSAASSSTASPTASGSEGDAEASRAGPSGRRTIASQTLDQTDPPVRSGSQRPDARDDLNIPVQSNSRDSRSSSIDVGQLSISHDNRTRSGYVSASSARSRTIGSDTGDDTDAAGRANHYRRPASLTSQDTRSSQAGHGAGAATFRIEARAPVVRDTSGWEEAWQSTKRNDRNRQTANYARSSSPTGSVASTATYRPPHLRGIPSSLDAGDRDIMSGRTGDRELDNLVNDLNQAQVRQEQRRRLPPPSNKAWAFKEDNAHPGRGAHVASANLGGPSEKYVEIARRSSKAVHPSSLVDKRPKLVVLDINNTLLARKKATTTAARNAVMRPYLASFLEYLCGVEERDGKHFRRFNVMIWSSAQPENVHTMVMHMGLTTFAGAKAPLLVDMWARDSMDIPTDQYHQKYPTVKDLDKVWGTVRWQPPPSEGEDVLQAAEPWSQYDTLLVDDTAGKACLQPYNHVQIPSFKPFPAPGSGFTGRLDDDDTVLLQCIGLMEQLRLHDNVSAALRSGKYGGLGRTPVGEQWQQLGLQALQRLKIPVQQNFDRTWANRVLEGKDLAHSAVIAKLFGLPTPNPLAHQATSSGW